MTLQHKFFDMLMQSQYWSAAEMRTYQRSQLAQLLNHARKNVPFYRTRLDAAFHDDGQIDWDKWSEIPVLKRADLLDHRQEMQATSLPVGHGETREYSSSGSTGRMVTVTHTGLASMASQATIFRSQSWHDIDWSKNMCSWAEGGIGESAAETLSSGPWGPVWDKRTAFGNYYAFWRPDKTDNVLNFLQENELTYLATRAKSAQELALAALKRGLDIKLGHIWTFGSGVTEDEREDCRRAFNCEIISLYSAKEAFAIGYQCPTGRHFHINSEIVLCEILNDNDAPCEPGEMGRVIVTPLYSTAQPIIRYELGDMAVPGAACSCGRTLPVIERIVGRTTHLFRFPDGSVIAPLIPREFHRLFGADTWQLVQMAPLHIELRYTRANPAMIGDENAAADIIRRFTHVDATVSFKRLESLPTVPGGKFIEYLSEM